MSPILDRDRKLDSLICVISSSISQINLKCKPGPALYFYQRAIRQRKSSPTVDSFVRDDGNIEIIYATLVSWNMDCRRANMKYFPCFKDNIVSSCSALAPMDGLKITSTSWDRIRGHVEKAYQSLALMKTKGRLVSNSKVLHFLLPELLMPMDKRNTLELLYGSESETLQKYLDAIAFSLDVARELVARGVKWESRIDENWNQTLPKMIDNAILLLDIHQKHGSRIGGDAT